MSFVTDNASEFRDALPDGGVLLALDVAELVPVLVADPDTVELKVELTDEVAVVEPDDVPVLLPVTDTVLLAVELPLLVPVLLPVPDTVLLPVLDTELVAEEVIDEVALLV